MNMNTPLELTQVRATRTAMTTRTANRMAMAQPGLLDSHSQAVRGKWMNSPKFPSLPPRAPPEPLVALHQAGQEGVEADDEPLVDVERLEQSDLHPVPGAAERFHEMDGHRVLLDILEGICGFSPYLYCTENAAAPVQGVKLARPGCETRSKSYNIDRVSAAGAAAEEEDLRMRPFMKFFSSVKLAIVLLILITLASILGTLIPQGRGAAEYAARYGSLSGLFMPLSS